MKTMTCKQLGGACDKEFCADTFETMAELSKQHGMEMHQQQDTAHLGAMQRMQELMKNPGLCLAGDGNRSKELGLYNFLGYDITHAWPTSARDRRATNATS